MRKAVIAGNWKLHKTISEAVELVEELKREVFNVQNVEIIVAPVYTALNRVAQSAENSNISVAAQNCYPETTGAFTGEVSPLLLKDAGCKYVIVGHSERRQIFGESDAFINRKMNALLGEKLRPIFCIGETLDEREGGRMFDVLTTQLRRGLQGLQASDLDNIVIAYEPVWAIGTGRTASNEQAQEAHAFIRGLISESFGVETASALRILYGGSVKPENIDGLMAQPDVDGALVGGASLKASDFARIVKFNAL